MSHVVTIKSAVKDEECAKLAALAVGAVVLKSESHKLWGSQHARGFGVQLKGWGFPLVFDLATGEYKTDGDAVSYDRDKRLPEFVQAYGIEVAKKAARLRGRVLVRTVKEPSGAVRLVFAG